MTLPIEWKQKRIRTWSPGMGIMPYGMRRTMRGTHRVGLVHYVCCRMPGFSRRYRKAQRVRWCTGIVPYAEWRWNQREGQS